MSQQQAAPLHAPTPDRSLSQLGLWSMIIGILSLCIGPLGLIALVMGIVGITRTSKPGGQTGMGFAIAGTALGGIGLFFGTCFQAGMLLPALGKARQTAMEIKSRTQLEEIGQAMSAYAARYDGRYPPAPEFERLLIAEGLIEPDRFESPRENGDGVSYIFLGAQEDAPDAREIIAYEDPAHSEDSVLVLFADGHTEIIHHAIFARMLEEQGEVGP